MRKQSLQSLVTVVMALVVVTSMAAGTAMAQSDVDAADPADEVFVDEDGNAVLVYDEDADETDAATGEFGLDVGESVVYALITDDMEEDITAAFSLGLDEDGVESAGSFVVDRPHEISDVSMDVTGEQTDEVNEFDATLDLVLDTHEFPEADVVQSADLSGEMVTSADEFTTHGEFSATHIMSGDGPNTGLHLEVSEQSGDYTIDVEQQNQVSQFEADDWETEAAAKAALEDEFGEVAAELGGDATVTVHSHEFEADDFGGGFVDVAYTIELENVTAGLEQAIADDLANDPAADISQADAEQFAEDILAFELDAFELGFQESDNVIDGEWNVAISNYDAAALAAFDLMENIDEMDDELGDEFDDYADMYEAQVESGLVETATWDVTYEQSGASEATLSAEYNSATENWEAYVAELEDRGVENPEFSIDAHVETIDDEIDVEMSLELSQEDLLQSAITAMIEDLRNDPTVDDDVLEFASAFDEADLELAKFDLDMDDGTATIEAGATFDDMTAFEGQLTDAFHGLTIEHVYGDEDAAYVYTVGLVDGDATEDDVRDHAIVDAETVVHMPGEWDEDHPRLDMDRVSEYLELDDDDVDDDSDDGLPGFGAAAALVALLSTLLWVRYDN